MKKSENKVSNISEFDKKLFELLDKRTNEKWNKFSKYYLNDSKKFINKISRDNLFSGKFPIHIYKTIKSIDKEKYDSAVCVLRGALPYAIMFELLGWEVHYVVCGRINEKFVKDKSELRFNKSVDKSLKKISNKKILIIENNVVTGNSPIRVAKELKRSFRIKKPDLFLDYFVPKNNWMKNVNFFDGDKSKMGIFDKIYIATRCKKTKSKNPLSPRLKISWAEEMRLKKELLERLK